MEQEGVSGVGVGVRGFQALRRIVRALDVHSRKLYRECNITSPQLLCLHSLEKNRDQTLSRMAEELNLSVSTMNGIVDRLEARGLVLRSRSEKDHRKVHLSITAEGTLLLSSVPELMRDSYARAFGSLSDGEQELLTGLLVKLADRFDPVHRSTGGSSEII
ncbi:MAG: MarR family transcriptional regulator [Chlorobium sp.]|nr:MarR family transcriptional regulator [Chlorobium phaeovibrioides]NQU46708.1 MarR family transcriptional regulator [Chlorobium sp.]